MDEQETFKCVNCWTTLRDPVNIRKELNLQQQHDDDDVINPPQKSGPSKQRQEISINIQSALLSIYKWEYIIHKFGNMEEDSKLTPTNELDEALLVVCKKCHTVLTNLYQFYEEFQLIRAPDSFLGQKISNCDKILGIINQPTTATTTHTSKDPINSSVTGPGPWVKLDRLSSSQIIAATQGKKPRAYLIDDDVDSLSGNMEVDDEGNESSSSFNPNESFDDNHISDHSISPRSSPLTVDEDADPVKNLSRKTKSKSSRGSRRQQKNQCTKCSIPIQFSTKSLHQSHNILFHPETLCPADCGIKKLFLDPKELEQHLTVCPGKQIHPCPHCPRSYTTKGNLAHHMKTHEDDKEESRHPCIGCSKIFYTSSDLKKHAKIHSTEKSFVCEICGRAFKAKHQLNDHQTYHKQDRPFLCPHCGKAFTHNTSLTRHLLAHSDEKKYKCSVCDKAFKYANTLRSHRRSVCTSSSREES